MNKCLQEKISFSLYSQEEAELEERMWSKFIPEERKIGWVRPIAYSNNANEGLRARVEEALKRKAYIGRGARVILKYGNKRSSSVHFVISILNFNRKLVDVSQHGGNVRRAFFPETNKVTTIVQDELRSLNNRDSQ